MPQISAIIPTYNVERYLPQCLDSVLAQSFTDFEIICVNDGSTDNSLSVLRSYAAKDERIRIIDKPNTGYGNSVNTGINAACGEYISIVEPDDFISPTMYEDLIKHSHTRDGKAIDIIKGSYWDYYDAGRDGLPAMVATPSLDVKMPNEVKIFTLEEDPTIVFYHPSVWSALYRRAFLIEKNIRLVEPPGAAWADNPFLYETCVLADLICWVPKPVYYHRQSNTDSSSFLKDYHIPLDRLADINAFLSTQNPGENVRAAVYNRAYYYLSDIIDLFNFGEEDPELYEAAGRILDSMDSDIIANNENIEPDLRAWYFEHEHGANNLVAHEINEQPDLSIIMPIGSRDGDKVGLTLSSISALSRVNLECLCVSYGGPGRAYDCCMKSSQTDRRIRLIERGENLHEALNAGMQEAQGRFALCILPGSWLDSNDRLLEAVLLALKASKAQACFCMPLIPRTRALLMDAEAAGLPEMQFLLSEAEALPEQQNVEEQAGAVKGDIMRLFGPLSQDIAKETSGAPWRSELLARIDFALFNRVFDLNYVRDQAIQYKQDDASRGIAFACTLLLQAPSILFSFHSLGGDIVLDPKIIPFPTPLILNKPSPYASFTLAAQSIRPLLEGIEHEAEWMNAWKNVLVVAFVTDINCAPEERTVQQLIERHKQYVCDEILGADLAPDHYHDIGAYNTLLYIAHYDFASYGYRQFCLERFTHALDVQNICERDWKIQTRLQSELNEAHGYAQELLGSTSFRIGNKLVKGVRTLVPSSLVSKLRH